MKKLLRRVLLCITLIFIVWAGCLYSCAIGNRRYNVIVESERYGRFSIGSGVVISKNGLILTAGHCIKDADQIRVTLQDGRMFDVNDYYFDSDIDVGLIKLSVDVNDYIMLADSNDIKRGSIIYNIGNAKGIWSNSIFFGIVYENHFKRMFLGEHSEYILTKLGAQPGCSGGGVWHYKKLIGIVVSGYDSAIFVIPSNVCQKIIEEYQNASKE